MRGASTVSESLIRLVMQGDESAWNRLLTQARIKLRKMARRKLPRRLQDWVSDIVQQTLLEADSRLGLFLQSGGYGDSNIKGWLHRILMRNILDARKRKYEVLLPEPPRDHQHPTRGFDGLCGSRPSSPERALLAQQAIAGWAALSPRQAEVIWLRFAEGLSLNEISERTGCTAGAVAVQICRAIAILRKQCHKRLRE